MCESSAYYLTENGKEKIMDNVIFVLPEQNTVYLEDILGDGKTVSGSIKEIKLLEHTILLQRNER